MALDTTAESMTKKAGRGIVKGIFEQGLEMLFTVGAALGIQSLVKPRQQRYNEKSQGALFKLKQAMGESSDHEIHEALEHFAVIGGTGLQDEMRIERDVARLYTMEKVTLEEAAGLFRYFNRGLTSAKRTRVRESYCTEAVRENRQSTLFMWIDAANADVKKQTTTVVSASADVGADAWAKSNEMIEDFLGGAGMLDRTFRDSFVDVVNKLNTRAGEKLTARKTSEPVITSIEFETFEEPQTTPTRNWVWAVLTALNPSTLGPRLFRIIFT